MQIVSIQQRHTDERVRVRAIDLGGAVLSVPRDGSPVDIEQIHAAVPEDDLLAAQEGETQSGDHRERQRQKPSEAGVDDGIDAVRLSAGVDHIKGNGGFQTGADNAANHGLVDPACHPIR